MSVYDAALSGDPVKVRRAVLLALCERLDAGIPPRETATVARRASIIAAELDLSSLRPGDAAFDLINAEPTEVIE